MTDKILLEAGYKEFKDTLGLEPHANRFFQKKVKDKKGIKYFINVYEYEIFNSYNYEFVLVCQKDKFWITTRLYAIENMDLEEIEKEIDKMWKQCKFNYYEVYDE